MIINATQVFNFSDKKNALGTLANLFSHFVYYAKFLNHENPIIHFYQHLLNE